MTPISPVIPGLEELEIVYGADQPEYNPLPALQAKGNRQVVFRFQLSREERQAVIDGADVYISVLTFGHPLQPQIGTIAKPDDDLTEHNLDILRALMIEV